MAVGGDPATPEGPYHSALEVIQSEMLVPAGVRSVSIGGYPEGHPGIPTAQLWAALEHKFAALAEQGIAAIIITQFGFDVDSVVRWLDELRQRGIGVPVTGWGGRSRRRPTSVVLCLAIRSIDEHQHHEEVRVVADQSSRYGSAPCVHR